MKAKARLLADDMARAKATLGSQRMIFEETEVVTVKLKNRPGALGRAAACLGENHRSSTTLTPAPAEDPAHVVLVFGVDNLNKGAAALDALAAEDARRSRHPR